MAFWNDERVEQLKKLWAEGLSANKIAQRMGGVSRNSVLGKLHRLGLGRGRAKPKVRFRAVTPGKVRKANPVNRPAPIRFGGPPKLPEAPPPIKFEEVVVPLEERRKLKDLPDGICRWPIGDPLEPDFHFCNRKQVPGLPYCQAHAQRAYRPPEPRPSANRETAVQAKPKELVVSE